ncbi:MAG: hypothetical protein IKD31_07020 [Clostridia bacterium]|nr:hypothetical protein [Clostridia bacterium]
MDLAPFESQAEHILYCRAAGVPFEEGAIGFKFFSEGEKLGLCQLKPVGDAIYVLSLTAIDQKISTQVLANLFSDVVQFMYCLEFSSVVYPIQNREDAQIAASLGFDRISDTLFVFDFPSTEEKEESEEHCTHEGCDCHHTAH